MPWPCGDVLGAGPVDVRDADDLQPGEPVGGQVRPVDDAAGADDGDRPLVLLRHEQPAGVGDVPEEVDHDDPFALAGSRYFTVCRCSQ
jgi:hypothetical protein